MSPEPPLIHSPSTTKVGTIPSPGTESIGLKLKRIIRRTGEDK